MLRKTEEDKTVRGNESWDMTEGRDASEGGAPIALPSCFPGR